MDAAARGPHRTYRDSGGYVSGTQVWIEGGIPARYVEKTPDGLVVVRVDGTELTLPAPSVRAAREAR